MITSNSWPVRNVAMFAGALTLGAILNPGAANAQFVVTDLASNVAGIGVLDPNLVNPWGISESATSPFWVSINGPASATSPTGFQTPGLTTLYNGAGVPNHLGLTGTPDTPIVPGTPTGQVNNSGTGFQITENGKTGAANFIFASLDGTISAWSGSVDRTQAYVAATQAGASYNGLGLLNNTLYAANSNPGGGIDVFNSSFSYVKTINDPNAPAGYVPFNVQNLNGTLYVTYVDNPNTPTTGFVDTYNPTTGMFTRFTSGVTGLVGPWGLQIAPSDFGIYSNDLIVGDNATGEISAFNANGTLAGVLDAPDGNPIIEPNLWGLQFGNGGGGGATDELYFAATVPGAPGNTGLFGSITSVPEPSTYAVFGAGLLMLGGLAIKASKRKNG